MKVGCTGGARVDRSLPFRYRHRTPDGVGVPGVTDVIDGTGLRDAGYSVVPAEVLQAAADRGTRVHEAIARDLAGEEDPSRGLEPGDSGYWDGYLAWRDLARPEPVLVEHSAVSVDWPAYGGTLDLLALTSFGPALIDWKCRGYVHGDGYQTAGYVRLVSLTHPDPEVVDLASRARRYCVELKGTGWFKPHPHDDPMDLRYFVGGLITWHGMMNGGRRPSTT